ncbi:MAG: hypothetical protein V6Z86_10185 [Hyphomicrobiales bacterium]
MKSTPSPLLVQLAAGVVFDLSDAASVNVGWGWANPDKSDVTDYATAYQG